MKQITSGILLVVVLCPIVVKAQFSANNLMEFQWGNLIDEDANKLLTFYDQLELAYRYKGFRINSRIDQFHSSAENPYEYIRLSRFAVGYRKKGLELKAGNYFETLGRGLLLRGYEIKNSIFEDRIYRSRQGFYKDLLGVEGSYRYKFISAKALWGKMLNNQLPVGHPDRRIDEVGAGEMNFQFAKQKIGAIYLHHQLNDKINHFGSVHVSGNLFKNFDYYGELARNLSSANALLSFSDADRYGAYFNLNYSRSGFGASFELKDYQNFVIGSGIADPPTLVKEHTYRLLNRSTHVTEFYNERGYQFEIYYHTNGNTLFTLNHSKGKNRFGTLEFSFYEYFLETSHSGEIWQTKFFGDYSKDEVVEETGRITAGAYLSRMMNKSWSAHLNLEGQTIERYSERFVNAFAGLVFSNSTKFSASLLYEVTTDPFLISSKQKTRHYPAISISCQINSKNTIQLFAGQRRGGPACTSGICYEVLDFEGIELRYQLKL